jgi:hypothetical protein
MEILRWREEAETVEDAANVDDAAPAAARRRKQ